MKRSTYYVLKIDAQGESELQVTQEPWIDLAVLFGADPDERGTDPDAGPIGSDAGAAAATAAAPREPSV